MSDICKVCGNKLDAESGQCLKCYLESVKKKKKADPAPTPVYKPEPTPVFTSPPTPAPAPAPVPVSHTEETTSGTAHLVKDPKPTILEEQTMSLVIFIGVILAAMFMFVFAYNSGLMENMPSLQELPDMYNLPRIGSYHCVLCQDRGFGFYKEGSVWGIRAQLCWDCIQYLR